MESGTYYTAAPYAQCRTPKYWRLFAAASYPSRGIGWVDTRLLASALVAGARLWTADSALAAAARELNVAYEP